LKAGFLTQPAGAFQLVETLLLEDGVYFLLERHLARLKASARYYGFRSDEAAMRAALDTVRRAHPSGCWKARLLSAADGTVEIAPEQLELDSARRYRVAFAAEPVDSCDPALYHKTTGRRLYEGELRRRSGVDDVVFWNERGEVTESSVANVVVVSDGKKW